jgi:hypothetical protein
MYGSVSEKIEASEEGGQKVITKAKRTSHAEKYRWNL